MPIMMIKQSRIEVAKQEAIDLLVCGSMIP
jgi:hypothetical protein